jgi:hypothetical protein
VNQPTVVFCTTCKGRAEHIKETLPANIRDNLNYPRAKFVLLNYSSPDGLEEYIRRNHGHHIESGRLAFYTYPTEGPFRMAHAKNMAHRLGIMEGADILVNLDADNFTRPEFAEYVAGKLEGHQNRFLFAEMVRGVLPRGISGRIAVHRNSFLKAGGYDEKYEKWSPDDKDFNARLRRLGHHGESINHQFLGAITHNDRKRFREYPEAQGTCYEQFQEVGSGTNTVANFGNVGCGEVHRLSFRAGAWKSDKLAISPIPTRIYGIGLHKTATTSLCSALRILGFDAAHWENAHWAKAIYTEMTTQGRSPTMERHYALCDLPIPLLYKQLDSAYPGSKFILTVRDPEKWIASVEKHWSHEHNPFRHQWSNDPFTHRAHRLLYGQKGFDREVFLGRYHEHYEDVIRYFEERRGDLLILDMERPDPWDRLCGFLGCQHPNCEYPNEFVTARHHHHHHHHGHDFQI